MGTIIAVNLLGKFQMIDEVQRLNSEDMRSDMLLKLLIYMLMNRTHVISVQELSEALWEDDETENPAGALKNLVYRLRGILKKHFGERDYIRTARGGYFWNEEIKAVLDIEEFEQLCEKAKKEEHIAEKIHDYENALSLYQGDFVIQITDRYWAVTAAAYYHSMFLSAVKALADCYLQEKRYERMEEICNLGLRYDAVDEHLYCYRIRALIRQNKQRAAMEQYEQAKRTLKEALGISKTPGLNAVYQEILSMSGTAVAKNIDSVSREMAEEEVSNAFLCGYPVFQEIYRLESRKISRLGESEYVLLLTLSLRDTSGVPNAQSERFLIQRAMEQMLESIKSTLRIGDVVAQYSDCQYVILLPTCTYESSMLVANRILSDFRSRSDRNSRIAVKTEYEEVAVAESALVK